MSDIYIIKKLNRETLSKAFKLIGIKEEKGEESDLPKRGKIKPVKNNNFYDKKDILFNLNLFGIFKISYKNQIYRSRNDLSSNNEQSWLMSLIKKIYRLFIAIYYIKHILLLLNLHIVIPGYFTHKSAGFGHGAFSGFKVYTYQTKSIVLSDIPFVVVHRTPVEIALYRNAVLLCLMYPA